MLLMIELAKTSIYLFSFRTFTYLLAKQAYHHWVREVIVQDTLKLILMQVYGHFFVIC